MSPGDHIGAPVVVSQLPEMDYLKVQNTAVTSHPDSLPHLDISRYRAQNIATISGTLPLGSDTVEEPISVERPAEYFLKELRAILREKGITIIGGLEVRNAYMPVADTLFIHSSPVLSDLLKTVNKKSHNFFAEQLLKTLGAHFKGEGSFKKGASVVKNWLKSVGVPPSEFIMVDGSGLSRMNFISPFASAALLRWMFHNKEFPVFYESLPIAGVDGTLKTMMRNSAAQGNVHAKSGTVRHMRNLAGYVRDKKNRPYLFVIMVNNHSMPVAYIKKLQSKICILLSNFN